MFIILALFCAIPSVNGQTHAAIEEREELRISISDIQLRLVLRVSQKPILAQYISTEHDTLYVDYRNDKVSLPLSAISRIERKTDELRGNAGFGAIVGGFAGLIIAAISQSDGNGRGRKSTSNEFEFVSSSEISLINIGAGAAVGALIGATIRSPSWEVVHLPEDREEER